MTSTPVPPAAVEIAWKTLADFLGPDRYRAEQAVAALAAAGWLDDPERRAARQADHDAVVAERDALAERVAGAPEWRCPQCGAVTRARMADTRPPVPHE